MAEVSCVNIKFEKQQSLKIKLESDKKMNCGNIILHDENVLLLVCILCNDFFTRDLNDYQRHLTDTCRARKTNKAIDDVIVIDDEIDDVVVIDDEIENVIVIDDDDDPIPAAQIKHKIIEKHVTPTPAIPVDLEVIKIKPKSDTEGEIVVCDPDILQYNDNTKVTIPRDSSTVDSELFTVHRILSVEEDGAFRDLSNYEDSYDNALDGDNIMFSGLTANAATELIEAQRFLPAVEQPTATVPSMYLSPPISTETMLQRPFRCTQCTESYSAQWILDRHLRVHRKTSNERAFKCKMCGVTTGSEWSMDRHIKAYHSNDGAMKSMCDFCQQLVSKVYLWKHRRAHLAGHPIFKCTLCDGEYLQRSGLIEHISNRHADMMAMLAATEVNDGPKLTTEEHASLFLLWLTDAPPQSADAATTMRKRRASTTAASVASSKRQRRASMFAVRMTTPPRPSPPETPHPQYFQY